MCHEKNGSERIRSRYLTKHHEQTLTVEKSWLIGSSSREGLKVDQERCGQKRTTPSVRYLNHQSLSTNDPLQGAPSFALHSLAFHSLPKNNERHFLKVEANTP